MPLFVQYDTKGHGWKVRSFVRWWGWARMWKINTKDRSSVSFKPHTKGFFFFFLSAVKVEFLPSAGGAVKLFKPHLFPHDDVEASAGLVGEHDACEVVVSVGVHVKRHAEVDRAELVVSCSNKRVSVFANPEVLAAAPWWAKMVLQALTYPAGTSVRHTSNTA